MWTNLRHGWRGGCLRSCAIMMVLMLIILGPSGSVSGETIGIPPEPEATVAERLVVPFYYIDDPIGTIRIPSASIDVTVYQDDNEQNISRGAGHYLGSFLPGQDGNILIAGHRTWDVFYKFKYLEIGDVVYFETTYGYYVYQVDRFVIIEGTDDSIATDGGFEQLTMYTCYPFDYKGNAPQRYVVICTPLPAPDRPELLSARQVTPTRIRLNWSAVEGAARYEIFRSTEPDGEFSKIYTAFSTSFLNIRRKPGVVYYYKIRAYAYTNGKKVYGPFSEVARPR